MPDALRDMVSAVGARGGARLLAAFAVCVLAGCAVERIAGGEARQPARSLLSPLATLAGARLAPVADRTGLPLPRPGVAPLTSFIHPAAATLSANDVYIADSGARRVYRFDQALDLMVALPPAPAAPGVRLATGADYSIYVLDAAGRRVLRFARNGQLLATYADEINLPRPVALAVDDVRGEVLVADGMYNQLLAFHPLGRAAEVIVLRGDERNRVLGITGVALAQDGMHISDPLCRCVAVVGRDGTVRTTYGHHEIGQPGAIAIDRYQRVFVADALDRSIRVFAAGRLIDHVPAAALGVREVTDLSVVESRLIVSDGAGARVVIMRIAPPPREVQ